MNVLDFCKNNLLYLDGGMGTLLQVKGLGAGELPERRNLTHPRDIVDIHTAYFRAGSHVVCTNTFGANLLKYSREELETIIAAAVRNAKEAAEKAGTDTPKWVALDIGPSGRMLAPYGDLSFEDAVSLFAETVKIGTKHGADLIFIETMSDSYETKAALLAARENSTLPVFVSCAYGEDGKLLTGASPAAMVAMLEGLGADAIGVNCSLGPRALAPVIQEYLRTASVPIICKPNAGLPRVENDKTVYDLAPHDFAAEVAALAEAGVHAIGGCCGTTPDYIAALVAATSHITPKPLTKKEITCISSYTHAVEFGQEPILIGERINPTGKKRLKEALREGDVGYILSEGISQQEKGVHVLDVNVGLPEINERKMLKTVVSELQAIINLPLQIDTSDPLAMEDALRIYNGKAMLNSVNGKAESMRAVFPLAKKYGALVVALTLDENGIPATAEGRLTIARRILAEAERYGIEKKDIIFDPLALTVSADQNAARETLRAVELIRKELGAHTSLGVSNVSFGLPRRELVHSTFFSLALSRGLSAAIMNPNSADMMNAYAAYRVLAGLDENCADYIHYAATLPTATQQSSSFVPQAEGTPSVSDLQNAIVKGLSEVAGERTRMLLETEDPLRLVNEEIIPALNTVGERFERKEVYLPQLLMSAEAAKAAFEAVRARMSGESKEEGTPFVLATVRGDIHDIGKNIVKLLLENYGFRVVDLGKDVAPEEIVRATVELHAPVVGLSALMTTTVAAMEETISLLRREAPWCKVIVGGAVLTPEYATAIGADYYAKDAMAGVRYAQSIL